jgi:HEPN domain-containing protein
MVEKAEKDLKRFNKIKKVRDLVILGKDLNLSQKLLKMCKEITAAYIYTRYPNVPEVKEIEKSAKMFVEGAKVIIKWIKKQL